MQWASCERSRFSQRPQEHLLRLPGHDRLPGKILYLVPNPLPRRALAPACPFLCPCPSLPLFVPLPQPGPFLWHCPHAICPLPMPSPLPMTAPLPALAPPPLLRMPCLPLAAPSQRCHWSCPCTSLPGSLPPALAPAPLPAWDLVCQPRHHLCPLSPTIMPSCPCPSFCHLLPFSSYRILCKPVSIKCIKSRLLARLSEQHEVSVDWTTSTAQVLKIPHS